MMQLTELPEVSVPLPWHQPYWSQLLDEIAADRLPHALLLTGAQHTGKSRFALALSRLLLCADPDGGLNCGQCHACVLSAGASHGDFSWVQPEEKSRTIKIDQVRALVNFTHKTASFGLRKVIVLAPADSMNTNAFNALLKSLEEPSRDTYLLLVCHRLHNVPATIRSRCRLVRLPGPGMQASFDWLDQVTGERSRSEQLLALTGNRPLLAQQLYENDAVEEFASRRLGIRALISGKVNVPDVTAVWSDAEPDDFLRQLTEEIQQLLSTLSLAQLRSSQGRAAFELLDEFARLQKVFSAGSNPNKQLLVEAVLSKMHRELGGGQLGDNMPSQQGGAGV